MLEGILRGGFVPRNRLGVKFQLANTGRHELMPMKNILSLTIGDGESVTTSGDVRAESGSLSVTGSCTALPSRAEMHFLRGGAARSPFRSCSAGRLSAGKSFNPEPKATVVFARRPVPNNHRLRLRVKRLTASTVGLRCRAARPPPGQPRASPTRFHTADLFRVLEQTMLNSLSTT